MGGSPFTCGIKILFFNLCRKVMIPAAGRLRLKRDMLWGKTALIGCSIFPGNASSANKVRVRRCRKGMVYMKLEYIKAVLALSKSKSFGEAAENVFSTQSSLSKQIISVEKELGIKLIHRATKKDSIRLTHEGEIFVKHAAGIVEEYNALLDELKQEKDAGRQEIHLGFSVKSHISPDFLVKFQYEYPQCVIKVWNVGYSEAVAAMQNKSLDAAIFPYMMLESDPMQIIPFYHDPAFSVIELSNLCEVVVEMSEDNPLSKLKEVSIDQLKDETFIMNSKQTGSTSDFYTDTSDPLVRACISRGFYPRASDKIMVIGNDMKTAHMLIVNNYGIALRIVPVTDGTIPGLVRIPLEKNTIIIKTFLVFRRESNSKVLSTFSDYMIQRFGGKAVK